MPHNKDPLMASYIGVLTENLDLILKEKDCQDVIDISEVYSKVKGSSGVKDKIVDGDQ